jgi:signal transduction histidine kinase
MLVLVLSLSNILGRRVAANYNQVITYSKELEFKNQELDTMWKEIKSSRDQLADLNKTLEQRVLERTDQFEKANKELISVNEELYASNTELTTTMDTLRETQHHLIQSEKMAALGQLIAGIAHEINTPIGAIRSSIGNILESLDRVLEQLPSFFQSLCVENQEGFLTLLKISLQNSSQAISSVEERSLKKAFKKKLVENDIQNSEDFADMLVTMRIFDIESYIPLLKSDDGDSILKMAYTLSGLQRSAKTIIIAEERTSKIVFALKSYTHFDQSGKMVSAAIRDGIEMVLTLYQSKLTHGVEVVRNYEEIPPIMCYPDELNQVWTNIIDNALHAMNCKGTLSIGISSTGKHVVVSITDSGAGIPEAIKDTIFDPFFTTKPRGEGSGLGLDIVKKIIDKHKGEIKLESLPGKTTFSIYIPQI